MHNDFKHIRAVGFDLDGTLYAQSHQMDERIVELFTARVLAKMPELETLDKAKAFGEKKYRELESRKKTLEAIGYGDANEVMHEIFQQADSSQFLSRDERLIETLRSIREAKEYLYLITTAPSKEGKNKLAKLGVSESIFDLIIYGDNELIAQRPKDEVVFRHAIHVSGIPAQQHVYIGDREKADILAPQSVNMKAISVGALILAADAHAALIYDIKDILL
jgi:FMN phosphatase YigB (HAD superfamily)